MEIETRLVSEDPLQTPSLDWLSIEFTQPLADRAIGEINPIAVNPGKKTEFTYFVKAQGRLTKFDQIAIEASMPLYFIEASLDNTPIDVQMNPTAVGFLLTFPQAVRDNQFLAVRFAASVFLQGTQFNLFLQDSATGPQIRQQIDPGDANPLINGNTNIVNIPVDGRLFTNLTMNPPVLTPNDDGINDIFITHVDLVNVLVLRPLTLRVFDLSGRLLHSLEQAAIAGEQTLRWNGQAGGQKVPHRSSPLRVGVTLASRFNFCGYNETHPLPSSASE